MDLDRADARVAIGHREHDRALGGVVVVVVVVGGGHRELREDEAVRRSDGTYRITLARNARPENWLPTGADPDRNLVLMLRVYGPRETDSEGIGDIPDERLPSIERVSCD